MLIGPPTPRYLDSDTDGYGDPSNFLLACAPLPGRTSNGADCNDREITVHPAALERCNSIDDNCNGAVDESGGTSYWPDGDGDGQGDADADLVTSCARPTDHAPNGDDCDDADPTVYLGAPERCTNLDNNCNGLIDDVTDAQFNHWFDNDRDGYGNPNLPPVPTCTPIPGLVTNDDDCDDTEGNVFPGNPETCDSLDNNCNRSVDEGVLTTFWFDFDLDGFGNPLGTGPYAPLQACFAPPGWVSNDDDCDDTTNLRSPIRVETCDHLDNDCDLTVDDGVRTSYWPDDDRDLFGDEDAAPLLLCAGEQPAHWVTNNNDCDDDEPTTYPFWEEVECDGVDNDCDGQADEGRTTTYFVDADGDGQASIDALVADSIELCDPIDFYAEDRTDCDDDNPRVKAGFVEAVFNPAMCDGLDNDCDRTTPADPPEACGADTLSVTVAGSQYLLYHPADTLNLQEAETWCQARGYHLWWVNHDSSAEALVVFANLDAVHNGVFQRDGYFGEVFHVGVRTHCPGVGIGFCNTATPQICFPRDYWHWRDGAPPRGVCDPALSDLPSYIQGFSATPRTMLARIYDTDPLNPTINVPLVWWDSAAITTRAFTLCERELP